MLTSYFYDLYEPLKSQTNSISSKKFHNFKNSRIKFSDFPSSHLEPFLSLWRITFFSFQISVNNRGLLILTTQRHNSESVGTFSYKIKMRVRGFSCSIFQIVFPVAQCWDEVNLDGTLISFLLSFTHQVQYFMIFFNFRINEHEIGNEEFFIRKFLTA